MKKVSLIGIAVVAILGIQSLSFGQVVGGRQNGEMTPKAAEPSKLSGGALTGDVNNMTGEFVSSIALGSVSTPSGPSYNLSLDYSSSFSLSATQAMTSGIPYGEGWGPNLPTISVESDAFHKFTCGDLSNYGGGSPLTGDLDFDDNSNTFKGRDEGDLYWFAPTINIPGVISGRAIFKYVDVADNSCLVFALNKFETSAEIRFYGSSGWEVRVANGDTYLFKTHLASYSAPSSQRVLFYDQDGTHAFDPNNAQNQVAANNDYNTHAEAVQNVVEPKESYTAWYCDKILNTNTPDQVVVFRYNKYGKFNYFQEFNQERYEEVRTNVFSTSTNTDYQVYSDIFLKDVYSAVSETPVDLIEMIYDTYDDVVDNATILDLDDPLVFDKDGLYTYKIVKEWGANGTSFANNWKRYKHSAAVNPVANQVGTVNSFNPYIDANGNYNTANVSTSSSAAFDHGFLESERLNTSGLDYYPGDIYEIKTTVSRPNGSDLVNGNGILDIAIKSGTLGNGPWSQTVASYTEPSAGTLSNANFEALKGLEIFSTFNSAVKWQMGYGQSVLETSNLFVMPNIPSTYHGFSIQIGPGNSDVDFGATTTYNTDMIVNSSTVNVIEAYPFKDGGRTIKSTNQISHSFGTGHPWAMMLPEYNEMALNSANILTGSAAPFTDLYTAWWATYNEQTNGRANIPTKFNASVELENVQLIRYSKNALMLQAVKVYKINGEFLGMEDETHAGRQLVSQKKLDYTYHSEKILRNYNYQDTDPMHLEDLLRKVILLEKISEVPVNGVLWTGNFNWIPDFNLSDPTQVITTTLEYTKYLNGTNESSPTFDSDEPYHAMNQYLLSAYIDGLGGITRVEYYPVINDATRIQSSYAFSSCGNYIYLTTDNNAESAEPFGTDRAYTIHPAVHYLSKNDEGDQLLSSSNVLVGTTVNPDLKVWEYVYNTATLMQTPKRIDLPQAHFRRHYFQGDEMAFKNVRVYSPFENSTAAGRNYVDFEYFGKVGTDPTLEEYLYYGKPKTIKYYSYDGTLEEETIYEYGHTLAFENAYLRPNLMRENLWQENRAVQDYEYRDIQENNVLEVTVGSTTYTGENAYPYLDVPFLNGNSTSKEQPKFAEFYFYNDIVALNPAFLLNSYFVKKTSEVNRSYENSVSILPVIVPLGTGVSAMPENNPFGSGFTNPQEDNETYDSDLIAEIGVMSDAALEDYFLSESPISDHVIEVLVASNVNSTNKTNILLAQGNLSNAAWHDILANRRKFSTTQLTQIINGQSYISDAVQMDFLDMSSSRDDANLVSALLLKNAYLSGQVVTKMINPSVMYPAQAFTTVIAAQPQMPESTLISIINSANSKSVNISAVLSNQFITDSMYLHILNNTAYTTSNVTQLVELATAFPSDASLIAFVNHSPDFTQAQLTQIFSYADREIGEEVADAIDAKYTVTIRNLILGNLGITNSLSQYCGNQVTTGRTYIETRKDFEYFEANQSGTAVGKAFEMLLGMRENVLEASPFPYSVTDPVGGSATVSSLKLKHEPSWQVFAVVTSSPQMPEAYGREEYYYLYDLKNRYDRHWYNYDFNNPVVGMTVVNEVVGAYSQKLVVNDHWNGYYQSAHTVPEFDGMSKTNKNGDRNTAFQRTIISKNTRDVEPTYTSEYFHYDSRWIFDDAIANTESHEISLPCENPPVTNDPCDDYVSCNDCELFFYKPYMDWGHIVPYGYCAWFVPNLGYLICPSSHDVSVDFSNATLEYCESIPQANQQLQPGDKLKNTLQLRAVTAQVDAADHSTTQEFANNRLDSKNSYIAEFYMGSPLDTDADGFDAPYHMIFPSDKLTVRTIKERNRYMQPELEENAVGLKVKYFYNNSTYHWYADAACPLNNYTANENTDIGLPTKVIVGYTLSDALETNFEYTEIGQVKKITEPNGKETEYSFDDYHRLIEVEEDGRVLAETNYHSWNLNPTASFDARTDANYVESIEHNSAATYDFQKSKAFVDPLGRNQGNALNYTSDGMAHHFVHSGYVSYDNLGRVVNAEKTYANQSNSSTVFTPVIPKSQYQGSAVETTKYEPGFKGRALRQSNFDVDVNGTHAVKHSYLITNNMYASCELNLSLTELHEVMKPNGTSAFRFYRNETLDQDDKKSVEYINALGQKVASLNYNGTEKIITLFVYDSYGNLTKTINPEKQNTRYMYNKLGQLVIEITPDAGRKHIMYNKQGLVSVILDDQGRLNRDSHNDANPFYRVMEYDIYGHLTTQGRSFIANEDHSMLYNDVLYGPLHYITAFVGASANNAIQDPITAEYVYFDYTFSDAQTQDWLYTFDYFDVNNGILTANGLVSGEMSVDKREKTLVYGATTATNELGKLIASTSYNENDQAIQQVELLYDLYGNVSQQEVAFHADGTIGSTGTLYSKITYPAYNYRHALLEEKVDVNNDGTVDFHCLMDYDPLNRLTAIYGACGEVSTAQDATLLVSYTYDDARGTVDKKTHYFQDGGLEIIAAEIAYSFDVRDRLTRITAGQMSAGETPLMDYELFYDAASISYNDGTYSTTALADQNWNGNINGTRMTYGFASTTSIINNVSGFDLPTVYGYQYDGINRLLKADGTVGDLLDAQNLNESYLIGNVSLTYDRIGNIQTLHRTMRNTVQTTGSPYTMLQHFNYQYATGTNRLTAANGVTGSGTATRNYTYDAIGNVLTDDSKNLIATQYGRASYPFAVTMDPDNDVLTANNETVNYLYSANDLRIYKKDRVYNSGLSAYETQENYYLVDAMGHTIALYQKGFGDNGWEYYASGSEREARVKPTSGQTPGSNSGLPTSGMQIGKDQATFYLNDHLGNTRVTYTPQDNYGTPNVAVSYDFNGTLHGWAGNNATVSNVSNGMQVVTAVNVPYQNASKVLPTGTLVAGQVYTITLNADLGNTPNGVRCNILNGENFDLVQGANTHTFTANALYPNAVIYFEVINGNNQPQAFTYSIDEIVVGQQLNTYAINKIDYVADYFPYGKVLREYVDGQQERFLTTQHERDVETGLDYRGARYYDSDIARFLSLDPKAADYASWSPYNYVLGNPISLIDPDGKSAEKPKQPILTVQYTRTVQLYEEDGASSDDFYGDVKFIITAVTYDDGSIDFSSRIESSNIAGVGVSGEVTLTPNGIVDCSVTFSEGDQSEVVTTSSNASISMPGSAGSVGAGGSKTHSKGTERNGASATIGFTLVYNPNKKTFVVTDNITTSEKRKVANTLENAENFPVDGLGLWGLDNQELKIIDKTSRKVN